MVEPTATKKGLTLQVGVPKSMKIKYKELTKSHTVIGKWTKLRTFKVKYVMASVRWARKSNEDIFTLTTSAPVRIKNVLLKM